MSGKVGDSKWALILFRNHEWWLLGVLCEFIFLELDQNCRILRRANRLLFHAPKACCLELFVSPPKKERAPAAHRVVSLVQREAGKTANWSVLAPTLL